jgi:hypothetical protein
MPRGFRRVNRLHGHRQRTWRSLNHECLADLQPGLKRLLVTAEEPERFRLIGPGEGGMVGTVAERLIGLLQDLKGAPRTFQQCTQYIGLYYCRWRKYATLIG